MKNIAAFALLSLALVSCKKETTTITKVDPKTGKTVTVEVPADSVKTVAENPAIKDSLGIFKQSFKLKKGETYPLTTYQRNILTMTDPSGKTLSKTSESTDEMSFVVDDVKGNVYDITINLIGKRNSESGQGKTVSIDTKEAEPKEEQLKMLWIVNKALMGNKLQMKMDNHGKVISITGFEAIFKKVETAVAKIVKEKADRDRLISSLKQTFNEAVLKEQFSKNLMILPKKGAKIGEKWSLSENADEAGTVKVTSNYQLKSVGNGIAEISVSGGIPKKTNKQKQEDMVHSLSSELSQNGVIKFDQNTGWITHQNINMKTTQIETISKGNESQSMKSVSNATVMVNPSAK